MKKIQSFLKSSILGKVVAFLVIILPSAITPLIGTIFWLIYKGLLNLLFSEFGLKRPKNIYKIFLLGIPAGIGLKLIFKSVIMPFFGANAKNETFQFLEGNLSAALGLSAFVIISAGLCEEIIYRGYLFYKLKAFFNKANNIEVKTILVSSVIFGLPHLYQGINGAIQATLIGVIFGIIYIRNNYNLWLLVVIHSAFDLFSIFLIYNNLEEKIAHLFILT